MRNTGCKPRKPGLLRQHILRPGPYPGFVGTTTRPSVFVRFALMPCAAQAPRGLRLGQARRHARTISNGRPSGSRGASNHTRVP